MSLCFVRKRRKGRKLLRAATRTAQTARLPSAARTARYRRAGGTPAFFPAAKARRACERSRRRAIPRCRWRRPGSTAAEGCETAGCCGADCIKAAGRAAGGKQAERNRAECENPDRHAADSEQTDGVQTERKQADGDEAYGNKADRDQAGRDDAARDQPHGEKALCHAAGADVHVVERHTKKLPGAFPLIAGVRHADGEVHAVRGRFRRLRCGRPARRIAQQVIERAVEQRTQADQLLRFRIGRAGFPLAHGLPRNAEQLRKLLLRVILFPAQRRELITECHFQSFFHKSWFS